MKHAVTDASGRARSLERPWTWRRVERRAVDVLREDGVRALAFKTLGETVYRRMTLVERRLDEPIPPPDEIDRLTLTDIGDYVVFRPDTDPTTVRRRLDAGEQCFVVRRNGHIADAKLGADALLDIEWVDVIPPEPSGKVKVVISEVTGKARSTATA